MASSWNLIIEGNATQEDLDHIASLVKEGYTSGQLVEQEESEEIPF